MGQQILVGPASVARAALHAAIAEHHPLTPYEYIGVRKGGPGWSGHCRCGWQTTMAATVADVTPLLIGHVAEKVEAALR